MMPFDRAAAVHHAGAHARARKAQGRADAVNGGDALLTNAGKAERRARQAEVAAVGAMGLAAVIGHRVVLYPKERRQSWSANEGTLKDAGADCNREIAVAQ